MIKLVSDPNNIKILKKIKNIAPNMKEGIRLSYIIIGKYLKRTNKKDFFASKSGRIYNVEVNGISILHQASAPGEPPANLSGNLLSSIKTHTSGYYQMSYSAGNNIVDYAERLEYGDSKIAPRPYMIKSIDDNLGKIYVTFNRQVRLALK